MKRKIIDYSKLTPDLLMLLTLKFPDGYGDNDIITFNNLRNEKIEAVEVQTDDTIYLVKVGSKLQYSMVNFDNDEDSGEIFDNDEASNEIKELDLEGEVSIDD